MATTVSATSLELPGGLVSVPVALKKASEKKDTTFDRATPNGNRIKRLEVDEVTGEVVSGDEIQRGVWDSDGTFRPIDPDTIAAIQEQGKIETLSIDGFIPLADVPTERFEAAYFVTPQKDKHAAAKPLKLLAEALRRTKKAGILKLCLRPTDARSRQKAGVIYEKDGGLMLNVLMYAGDFAQAAESAEVLSGVAVEKAHVEQAMQLVELTSVGREVLDGYEDDVVELRARLVEDALSGRKVKRPVKQKKEPTTDGLADALAASIEAAGKQKSKPKKPAPVAA